MRVAILGAGAIAPPYYAAIAAWPQLDLVACAARSMASAGRMAAKHGIVARSFDGLLADLSIEAIVNLTPGPAHYETSRRILEAGKHLYSEKPLAGSFAEASALVALADAKNLRIGCAPDTFFGAAHQAARAAIDSGAIGRPVAAAAFLGHGGSEAWHPNPAPFYARGGGPLADHGPYYLTQLVNLLGPIEAVTASGLSPRQERTARDGSGFPVEELSTISVLVDFESGARATLTTSWDIPRHRRAPIEIYGDRGTLINPDPNWSDGELLLAAGQDDWAPIDPGDRPFLAPTMITFQGTAVAYYRLCGLADMADAIAQGRPHRASGALALHVVEAIDSARRSAETGHRIPLVTRCARPAPIGDDIAGAHAYRPFGPELLDARTLV